MAENVSMIGYTRVSKADGSQVHHLQHDALIAAGVNPKRIYQDSISGARDSRPGLDACLAALAPWDTLVIWKLDRLGRSLRHLVNTFGELTARGIGLKVITGEGVMIDTTTASGRLMFGIFAALAEFERELIVERTRAGIAAAQACHTSTGRSAVARQTERCPHARTAHQEDCQPAHQAAAAGRDRKQGPAGGAAMDACRKRCAMITASCRKAGRISPRDFAISLFLHIGKFPLQSYECRKGPRRP